MMEGALPTTATRVAAAPHSSSTRSAPPCCLCSQSGADTCVTWWQGARWSRCQRQQGSSASMTQGSAHTLATLCPPSAHILAMPCPTEPSLGQTNAAQGLHSRCVAMPCNSTLQQALPALLHHVCAATPNCVPPLETPHQCPKPH